MHNLSIAPVRIKYPNPVPAKGNVCSRTAYCVGGALCHYYGITHEPFPPFGILSKALQKLNPRLDWRRAERYAEHIILSNDAGKMQRAWVFAQAALSYGRQEE